MSYGFIQSKFDEKDFIKLDLKVELPKRYEVPFN